LARAAGSWAQIGRPVMERTLGLPESLSRHMADRP